MPAFSCECFFARAKESFEPDTSVRCTASRLSFYANVTYSLLRCLLCLCYAQSERTTPTPLWDSDHYLPLLKSKLDTWTCRCLPSPLPIWLLMDGNPLVTTVEELCLEALPQCCLTIVMEMLPGARNGIAAMEYATYTKSLQSSSKICCNRKWDKCWVEKCRSSKW